MTTDPDTRATAGGPLNHSGPSPGRTDRALTAAARGRSVPPYTYPAQTPGPACVFLPIVALL